MPEFEIQLIAVIASVACAVLGTFIVLRKMSMLTDAITHTILLGIVLAYFISKDLSSPLLYVGAIIMGLFTVYLVSLLQNTHLLSEEAAIGVVFPFLFSIAIILISLFAGSVHLDTDSVLLGELAFAPFDRLVVFGIDIGAKSIYTMGLVLILNAGFVKIFYKELQLSSFDSLLAYTLGFAPTVLHYLLMTFVSITAVSAFSVVGSILVVAFMIAPPITARLLTHELKPMIWISALIGAFNALIGYQIARSFDVSIAGSMALMSGLSFVIVLLFSRQSGMITRIWQQLHLKRDYDDMALLIHLFHHYKTEVQESETNIHTIVNHLNWEPHRLENCVKRLLNKHLIVVESDQYQLTSEGIAFAAHQYTTLFK